jgi:hypothetical protein
MNTKFVAAIAVCAAFAAPSAIAQQKAPQPAPQQEQAAPKASKAEVQKLVEGIKADKAKLTQFCGLMKLQDQYTAAAEKKDEKKLEALDKQMEEGAKNIGPDFDRITQSELDEEATNLLDGLANSCSKT